MKKSTMLGLAIAASAAVAIPSATSARLADVVETTQAQPNYAQYRYGPYRWHVRRVYRRAYRRAYYGYPYSYGGYGDTLLTLTADILPTSMAGTIVRPISGDGTNAVVGLALIGSRPHAEPAADVERRGRFDRVT